MKVGRKTRRAQEVTNYFDGCAPVLSRAVGVAWPNDILKPFHGGNGSGEARRHVLMAHTRSGSKPARVSERPITFLGAPSSSPHRIKGVAFLC
jgi:hypothetical protein